MRSEPLLPADEDSIVQYLLSEPTFFERHAAVLAALQLVSPHGQRAVSLQERQTALLRDKLRSLELKLAQLIRHGQDNSATADKLHRWSRELLRVRHAGDLPATAARSIATQFIVAQVSIKLWHLSPDWADAPFTQGADAALIALADSLTKPFCGTPPGPHSRSRNSLDSEVWAASMMPSAEKPRLNPTAWQAVLSCLDDPAAVASVALMALRTEPGAPVFGLLVLASGDAQRFTPDMGTDFLERMADTASAALSRLLPA